MDIRILCPYCKKPFISNSRHQEHSIDPIIGKAANMFSSYVHCMECGSSAAVDFSVRPLREPFKQEDLFPA